MQFLDALGGLRTQGFPDDPITTRRYEILQRFIDGISDPTLRQELAVVYVYGIRGRKLSERPTHGRVREVYDAAISTKLAYNIQSL